MAALRISDLRCGFNDKSINLRLLARNEYSKCTRSLLTDGYEYISVYEDNQKLIDNDYIHSLSSYYPGDIVELNNFKIEESNLRAVFYAHMNKNDIEITNKNGIEIRKTNKVIGFPKIYTIEELALLEPMRKTLISIKGFVLNDPYIVKMSSMHFDKFFNGYC